MGNQEVVVFAVRGSSKYLKDGQIVDMPAGWEFVPSGDPALTRRLKLRAPSYWVVKRQMGRKEWNVGLCVPVGLSASILRQLEQERESPEYKQKLEAGRKYREKEQAQYQRDFEAAVVAFLNFHERWKDIARQFAAIVTVFATPVGSGTVARTERIPIEERARAAVIAWMRHQTTDYDRRTIPRIAGKRREVRRELAHESLAVLESYRRGDDAPAGCPLQAALSKAASAPLRQHPVVARNSSHAPKPTISRQGETLGDKPRLKNGDFWL